MPVDMQSLWAIEEIKIDVKTPLMILRAQAADLRKITSGLLEAEVVIVSFAGTPKAVFEFDIIAPFLGRYRHNIMNVTQVTEMPYPVTLEALADVRDPNRINPIIGQIGQLFGQSENEFRSSLLHSESEFIKEVRDVLQSPQVIAVLQSLIARSNESQNPNVTGREHEDADSDAKLT